MKNNIYLSNRNFNSDNNKFNTGRNNTNFKGKTKKAQKRAFSENRIKINIGIIKEICFVNNV